MSNWVVWKHEKNYQKLFWAGIVNGLGNRTSQVAILTLLYQVTGSGMAIGILLAIRMVPFLLFAPIGGILADRFSKKRILMTIDILRIPFALFPLFVHSEETLWIVFVSAFFIAAGEAFYAPTRMSTIPNLVKQERLLYVNAIEQMMIGVILVIGSSLGGIIAYLIGLHVPFILNGLTFLISAILLSKITITTATAKKPFEILHLPRTVSTIKLILGSAALLTFFIIGLTMPLANGIDNVLMSVYALDVFIMGDLGVGLIYASLGIGLITSSFFSNMLKRNFIPIIVVFIALEGVGHIFLSVAPRFWIAILIVIFITFVGGISNICFDTIMMKIVPKSRQGTFFGFMATISNTTMGIAMASTGFLLELFTPRTLSLVVGLLYIFFTLVYAILFSKVNLVKEKKALIKKMK